MRRPLPAVLAVVLMLAASACALPRPHLREPAPQIPPLPQTSLVFDDHGHVITQLHAGENRTLVSLDHVAPIRRHGEEIEAVIVGNRLRFALSIFNDVDELLWDRMNFSEAQMAIEFAVNG